MSSPLDKTRKITDKRIKHCKICGNDYHPSKSEVSQLCGLCKAVTDKFKESRKEHSEPNPHIGSDFDDWYNEDIETGQDYDFIKERMKERDKAVTVQLDQLEPVTEGKRDTSGKPPRHYFYEEGLIELTAREGKGMAAQVIGQVGFLEEALRDGDIEHAKHTIVVILLAYLRYMYAGKNLLSDTSYVVKMGAEKYGHTNYKKGMKFSYCISSFMGHLLKHAQGEDLDEESGYNHLLHCAANMLMLLGYLTDEDLIERFNDIPEMFK